jgi:hypothetical protein
VALSSLVTPSKPAVWTHVVCSGRLTVPLPVESTNSCGFARVVVQEPPEPFATLHRACTLTVLADRRKEQDIAFTLELVASFVNRLNLLKLWEKTATGGVSASGAYGPTNAAITRIPAPSVDRESDHFSDGTALACSCGP